jgi:hypothetical protein
MEFPRGFPSIPFLNCSWGDHDLPYNSVTFDAQAKLPRFSLIKRFIDTFKYINSMRFVLRQDGSLSLEAESDLTRHFTIIKPLKVFKQSSLDQKYKGDPVAAFVEVKKVSHFLHSLSFQTDINLCLLISNRQHMKFFFRFRDDILGHYILPVVFEDEAEDEEIPESE